MHELLQRKFYKFLILYCNYFDALLMTGL